MNEAALMAIRLANEGLAAGQAAWKRAADANVEDRRTLIDKAVVASSWAYREALIKIVTEMSRAATR